MKTRRTHQLLAAVLSIVMILSLAVVPAGAAVPMGGEAVAETPAEAAADASGVTPEADSSAVSLMDAAQLSADDTATTVAGGTYKWADRAEADRVKPTDAGITFAPDDGSWGYTNQHGPNTASTAGTYTLTLALAGQANVTIETCGYGAGQTGAATVTLEGITAVEGTPTMKSDGGKTFTFVGVPAGNAVFTVSSNTYIHGVTVNYCVAEGAHEFINIKADPAVAGINFAENWDFTNDHGPKTGAADQTMTLALSGDANVTIETCYYGTGANATVAANGTAGTGVSTENTKDGTGKPGLVWTFKKVPAGDAVFTFSTNTYVHGVTIAYITEAQPEVLGNGKVDVWDFGTETLDETRFNNMLTVDDMNNSAWGSLKAGEFGDATFNGLTWYAGKSTNHRLYTNNTEVTAAMVYGKEGMSDENGADPYFKDLDGYEKSKAYQGYIYSNNSASGKNIADGTVVYCGLTLNAGDKVTVVVSSNGGNSTITFAGPSGVEATSLYTINNRKQGEVMTFYAREDGDYKIYSADEKLVVARIYREHPTQLIVTGSVTIPEGTTLPAGTTLAFTNMKTGAVTEAEIKDGAYRAVLVAPYEYKVSTVNGQGFIVKSGTPFDLTVPDEGDTVTQDIGLTQVPLVSVSGTITGPDADYVATHKPVITMTPGSEYIYVPEVTVNGLNYSFEAQQGVEYTVGVTMINDYSGPEATKVTYNAATTEDTIAMTAKQTYPITVTADPDTVDLTNAKLTFVNLKEAGKGDETQTITPYDATEAGKGAYPYTYTYTGTTGIALRDGQYEVLAVGVGAPAQKATANLIVDGEAKAITINFDTEQPNVWNFGDADFDAADLPTDRGGDGNYKGLELEGNIQKNKTYMLMGKASGTISNAEVKIPVQTAGTVVSIEYCYSGSGTLGDQTFAADTCSGSTSKFETVTYTATEADATAGYVTLTIAETAGTTDTKGPSIYLTQIQVWNEPYKETLTVGSGKDYATIGEALDAVTKMSRTAEQRVTIEIDPGNYEEQLIITPDNVTLKNAKADQAELKLSNKGVDIGENEVRITHYYGTGYDYYSMAPGTFQWDADVLEASKANGYPATTNQGDGKYSGYGYWCASVLVKGSGFEAEGIIFENSFNQYVSAKSTEDTIVPNAKLKEDTNNPRAEMKTAGDTTVQKKAYVERAAALALTDTADKAYFNHCAFIGRQDTLYGDPIRAGFYDCDIYGGTDYIFGGMNAVFAQCDLVFNTSEAGTDVGYITAPQQSSGQRGYLMFNCTVTSTTPGENTASTLPSKPGGFGRPWSATYSEAVFYATNIKSTLTTVPSGESTAVEGDEPVSLITPEAWYSGLSAGSQLCTEYDTVEEYKHIDNSAKRSTTVAGGVLAEAKLSDGTVLDGSTYETWLGDWNPFPELTIVKQEQKELSATPADAGKIVILHSNDVHGAVDGYAKMAQLKADYEAAGAEVLVLDAGDFSQGTTYVSVSQGANAIKLMNLVGYDAATTGNHEFDYGAANLDDLVTAAYFDIMAANIKNASDETPYTSHVIFTLGEGESAKTVGVFGLETPETATKAHPAKIKGLSFLAQDELYACAQAEVAALQAENVDYIICLGHLGIDAESEPNRSIDLLDNVTGIDVFIDGHSHSTLDEIAAATNADRTVNGTVITSTGTKFANIGVITIDGETITTENVSTDTITVTADAAKDVQDLADEIKAEIDADYGTVFATSEVDLNGDRDPGNRTEETNLGDLICDAMLWLATKDELSVPSENVIALTNGGGIRASIEKGDVTKNDVNTVLPFGNTVAVDYVKGSVLLEALEASTYCTPTAVGGFPQVAGMTFAVDTTKTFDEGDLYPDSTYHKPNSIQRVTIESINGKDFDPDATYAVVTNDFVAAGGDTYYALSVSETITDTGIPLDEALMQYITDVLNGVIGQDYAEPQGRITVIVVEPADALADAIKAAKAALEDTEISEDGSDVYTSDVWTTQDVRDALTAAIEKAEDVAADETATADELAAAADDLNAALATFVAEQEAGTKRRVSSSTGTSTHTTDTTTTKTVTNDNGDVVKTVTKSSGDKEITVTNTDGEVIAEVSLPAAIPAPAIKFKDVPEGHWAEPSINDMAGLGLVKGVNEAQDLFDMTSTMTRASVATIFYRLSGSKAGFTSTFADVPEGQWYTDAVGWAVKTGVVTGYSETAFGPDDTITRQQLATMLQRYANLLGMDIKANANSLTAFTDADEAASWAADGLAWCVKNGIMEGRGNDVLDPAAPISRAEAAAMFDRMIGLMRK